MLKIDRMLFHSAVNLRVVAGASLMALTVSTSFTQAAVTPAEIQAYPSKPIRIITPFSPGGSGDAIMRVVGHKLTEAWGQSCIMDNRAGASGVIGLQMAAKAAPDGYTLVHGTASTHTINPILHKDLPYDPVRDFTPVAILMATPNIFVAPPTVRASSLKELIQLARTKPGQLSYASNGSGTVS